MVTGSELTNDKAVSLVLLLRWYTLLYSHATPGTLTSLPCSLPILCYDYVGYGLSTNTANVDGFWEICG